MKKRCAIVLKKKCTEQGTMKKFNESDLVRAHKLISFKKILVGSLKTGSVSH